MSSDHIKEEASHLIESNENQESGLQGDGILTNEDQDQSILNKGGQEDLQESYYEEKQLIQQEGTQMTNREDEQEEEGEGLIAQQQNEEEIAKNQDSQLDEDQSQQQQNEALLNHLSQRDENLEDSKAQDETYLNQQEIQSKEEEENNQNEIQNSESPKRNSDQIISSNVIENSNQQNSIEIPQQNVIANEQQHQNSNNDNNNNNNNSNNNNDNDNSNSNNNNNNNNNSDHNTNNNNNSISNNNVQVQNKQNNQEVDQSNSYQFMMELQQRQLEFQRQMEELNKKYKINFRKIIDVKQESLAGNYLTGLVAIKMNYKFVDTRDQYGFTMLHHAVLGNERELVLFLLNNGADVNSLDAQQRTPIMMAAHGGASLPNKGEEQKKEGELKEDSEEYQKIMKLHSFNKIFKILLERKACFTTKDIYQFSPLLYSVQTQNLLIFFYLVYLGANIHDSDMNGSSIVHWNAYKGNRFMMEVFKSLNLDLFTADNQGFTPLQRSLMGLSHETFYFLADQISPHLLPDPHAKQQDNNDLVILSESIRQYIIKSKANPSKLSTRISALWKKHCIQAETTGLYPAIFIFFLIAGSLFFTALTSIYVERENQSQTINQGWLQSKQFLINIFFFIVTFIFMSFSIRLCGIIVSYKNRDQGKYVIDEDAIDRKKQLEIEKEKSIPPFMKNIMADKASFDRILQRMNFTYIDRILENAHFKSTRNASEELHRTTITDNSYDEESSLGLMNGGNQYSHLTFIHQIAILFENNYFTSLGEINFKRLCGICLKYKPEKTQHCSICNTCVPYYSFHSTLYNTCICPENYFFYLLHLFSMWFSLLSFLLIESIQFSPYLTSWEIFKYAELTYIISYKIGIFHGIVYVSAFVGFMYCSLDCLLEIFAIFEGKTRDEILNPFDYPYNFEIVSDKKGFLLKVPKIRTVGVTQYLKETFTEFSLRTFSFMKAKK